MRIWLVRIGIGLAVALILAGLGLGLAQSVDYAHTATLAPPAASSGNVAPRPTITGAPASTPTLGLGMTAPSVEIVTATVSAKTRLVSVTVHVRQITGDYLFQPPALETGSQRLLATAASVENARLALLKLATQGETQAVLEFGPLPATGSEQSRTPVAPGSGQLIFNPESQTTSLVAPRVALPVAWPVSKK